MTAHDLNGYRNSATLTMIDVGIPTSRAAAPGSLDPARRNATQSADISSDGRQHLAVRQCIGALCDLLARRRIADAYLGGWIVAEDAIELLIDLDLIEYTPGAGDE